jgi:hypothetical protein
MADKGGLLGSGLSGFAPKRRDTGATAFEAATHPEDRSNLPESLSEVAVLTRRRQFPWTRYLGPAGFDS